MKLFQVLSLSAVLLGSTAAFSAPTVQLDDISQEALNVLVANPKDFAELSSYGNKLTQATVEYTSGEFARFRFVVQQCSLRGCLGGAMLTVERMTDMRPGLFPPYVYTTKLVRLR